jgi:hypothetical protein
MVRHQPAHTDGTQVDWSPLPQSKALRYVIGSFPPDSRGAAWEALASYGLRSLLASYRLDDVLALEKLEALVGSAAKDIEVAARDHARIKWHRRKAAEGAGKPAPKSPAEVAAPVADLSGRPDVLEKFPFVDGEGGVSDVLSGDARQPRAPLHHLAKREIRRIATKVYEEFKTSAHGIHLDDLSRALQILFEGDRASPLIAGTSTSVKGSSYGPYGVHLIRALAEEALPSQVKFAAKDGSELSYSSVPSIDTFAMGLGNASGGPCVTRKDASINHEGWLSMVFHIVRRLWQLENSGRMHDLAAAVQGPARAPQGGEKIWGEGDDDSDYVLVDDGSELAEEDLEQDEEQSESSEADETREEEVIPTVTGLRARRAPKRGSQPAGMHQVNHPPHVKVIHAHAQARKAHRQGRSAALGPVPRHLVGVQSRIKEQINSDRSRRHKDAEARKKSALHTVAQARLTAHLAGDTAKILRGQSPGELAMDIADAFLASNIADRLKLGGGMGGYRSPLRKSASPSRGRVGSDDFPSSTAQHKDAEVSPSDSGSGSYPYEVPSNVDLVANAKRRRHYGVWAGDYGALLEEDVEDKENEGSEDEEEEVKTSEAASAISARGASPHKRRFRKAEGWTIPMGTRKTVVSPTQLGEGLLRDDGSAEEEKD